MQTVSVHLALPDGTQAHLNPGDVIGRMASAALRVDDPRVSEAHALVSLRGERLVLLALRGALLRNGKPQSAIELVAGSEIVLASGLSLRVLAVQLPATALAIEGVEHGPVVLTASVYSLVKNGEKTSCIPGFSEDRVLSIWSTGEGWRMQRRGAPAQALDEDQSLIPGVRSAAIQLARASAQATQAAGQVGVPLRIVARFDTVQIDRQGWPTCHIGGRPARILSELVSIGAPVSWEAAAREIWVDNADRDQLRTRWDRNLSSLRSKLRAAQIRTDLVRSCGSGNIELLLHQSDQALDES